MKVWFIDEAMYYLWNIHDAGLTKSNRPHQNLDIILFLLLYT